MAWSAAKAMPEDKLTWKVSDDTRTARALLEELVTTAGFAAGLLRTKQMPSMEGGWGASADETLEELEASCRSAYADFLAAAKEFPEAEYAETVELPWGTQSYLEMIQYPYWNLVYHYGQINFIQTMYGDTK